MTVFVQVSWKVISIIEVIFSIHPFAGASWDLRLAKDVCDSII